MDHGTSQGVAYVGCYLPRACGIATFTFDLAEATARIAPDHHIVAAVAMTNAAGPYAYPGRVKWEIQQEDIRDYMRAADFINASSIDVVCIQHEYGIFGGESGSHVLALIRNLRRPVVVTCHTVCREPTRLQREIISEMAAAAERLVVMSRLGMRYLVELYGIPQEKIAFIPHGVHDMPFRESGLYKHAAGVKGCILSTFGLLHRNKGIEYMIEALPAILDRHPQTTYLILGATHPAIVREEGESYRRHLERLIADLHLEQHVRFHPQFMHLNQLLEYLGATDIFVTPYLNVECITSGALAYAVGAGKAVVSTPYWYACELLDEGRGCLVPMRDAGALSREIIRLMDDEAAVDAMRRKAYAFSRDMVWESVARSYLALFSAVSRRPAHLRAERASSARDFTAGTIAGE
jgi:glycosyltransferase involved in cell wall biosynthesis